MGGMGYGGRDFSIEYRKDGSNDDMDKLNDSYLFLGSVSSTKDFWARYFLDRDLSPFVSGCLSGGSNFRGIIEDLSTKSIEPVVVSELKHEHSKPIYDLFYKWI